MFELSQKMLTCRSVTPVSLMFSTSAQLYQRNADELGRRRQSLTAVKLHIG